MWIALSWTSPLSAQTEAPSADASSSDGIGTMFDPTSSSWLQSEGISYGMLVVVAFVVSTLTISVVSWWRARLELRRVDAIRKQLGSWARDRFRTVDRLERVETIGPESYGWNMVLDQIEGLRREAAGTLTRERPRPSNDDSYNDALLNDLPDGIAVIARDGSLTFANEALSVLLSEQSDPGIAAGNQGFETENNKDQGESAADAGQKPAPLSVSDHLRELTQDHQLLVHKPSVEVLEGRGSSQGRILRVSRHPRWSADRRELCGAIWTVRDITQQKLAERMRDEFLDSATHELRTPLANIKAYAETLAIADVIAVEQQKEFCNTINAEATRLARLIDDLLSISSMEVGSLSVNCQRTEVERLLKEVVGRVRPTMDKKNQKFHVLIDEKIPEMKLDKDKFSTILVNLLGNASKYTPENGNVTMRARVDETHLMIEVEDTGLGIAADELPRIFEKFFRSTDPRVQSENGTGLGLSLTQELVRLHGGLLTVRSQLNQGTCFTIRIPL